MVNPLLEAVTQLCQIGLPAGVSDHNGRWNVAKALSQGIQFRYGGERGPGIGKCLLLCRLFQPGDKSQSRRVACCSGEHSPTILDQKTLLPVQAKPLAVWSGYAKNFPRGNTAHKSAARSQDVSSFFRRGPPDNIGSELLKFEESAINPLGRCQSRVERIGGHAVGQQGKFQ